MRNKFVILFLLFSLFFRTSMFSQQITNSFSHQLSTCLIQPLLYGSLNLNYELLSPKKGFYFGADFVSTTNWSDYTNSVMFDLQFRNYLAYTNKEFKKDFHIANLYLAPLIRYRFTEEFKFTNNYDTTYTTTSAYHSITAGFVFGMKFFIGDLCFFDIYAGPAMRFTVFEGSKIYNYYSFFEYGYKGVCPVVNLTFGFVLK